MTPTGQPDRPCIYHILHVDRLPSVLEQDCLWCDAVMGRRSGDGTTIGIGSIKERRLSLPVDCHPGTHVGDYVPFYFCPRSIMLYVIHRANHPELAYTDGQGPIIHLETDLNEVVDWAESVGRKWAFSTSNAGAYYATFHSDLSLLAQVNWDAVASTDFRHPSVKEGKQAEFLVQESFPWSLVRRIGVMSLEVLSQVEDMLRGATHVPLVEVTRSWYY